MLRKNKTKCSPLANFWAFGNHKLVGYRKRKEKKAQYHQYYSAVNSVNYNNCWPCKTLPIGATVEQMLWE